jgi:uncharacterized protein
MPAKMTMRTLSINALLLSCAFTLCSCHKDERADGSYRVNFVWDGEGRNYKVVRKSTNKEADSAFRTEILRDAEPIVASEMRKANLVKAEGTFDVSAWGPPPYRFFVSGMQILNADFLELLRAVESDDTEKIRTTIARDPIVINGKELPSERSALFMAAAGRRQRSLQTLLILGADPNGSDFQNDSPLHAAVVADSIESVKLLISAGARVNQQNGAGITPTMEAAQLDRIEILRLLLRSGANTSLQSTNGETAETIARRAGNLKAATVLQNFSTRKISPMSNLKVVRGVAFSPQCV